MSFNIKQPEIDHLAREVAQMAGLSLTDTVGESLRFYREKLESPRRKKNLAARLLAISKECSRLPQFGKSSLENLLDDERGMLK